MRDSEFQYLLRQISKMIRLESMIFILFFMTGMNISARIIHIHKQGHNERDCGNKKYPCRTLQHAIRVADWNDEIQVSGPLPSETCTNEHKIVKNLTIRGQYNKSIIDCSNMKFRRKVALFSISSANRSEVGFTLENIQIRHIQSTEKFALLINSAFVRLINCQFIDIGTIINVQDTMEYDKAVGLVASRCLFHTYRTAIRVTKARRIFLIIQRSEMIGRSRYNKNVITRGIRVAYCFQSLHTVLYISVERSLFLYNHYSIIIGQLAKSAKIEIKHSTFQHCDTGLILTQSCLPRKIVGYQNYNWNVRVEDCTFRSIQFMALIIHLRMQKLQATARSKFKITLHNTTFLSNFIITSFLKDVLNHISFVDCGFNISQLVTTSRYILPSFQLQQGNFLFQNCVIVDSSTNVVSPTIDSRDNLTLRNVRITGKAQILSLKGNTKLINVTVNVFSISQHTVSFLYNDNKQLVAKGFEFKCSPGSIVKDFKRKWRGGYKTLLYFCDKCPFMTYTLESGSEFLDDHHVKTNRPRCMKCPYGAKCHGVITANQNYWGFPHAGKIDMKRCPHGYCVREGNSKLQSCSKGRSDTLCGRCIFNHSENVFNTHCTLNIECKDWWISIIYFLLALAYTLIFLYLADILKLFWRIIIPSAIFRRNSKQTTSMEDSSCTSSQITPFLLTITKVLLYFHQLQYFIQVREVTPLDQTKNKIRKIITDAISFRPQDHIISGCPFKGMTAVTKILYKTSFHFYIYVIIVFLFIYLYLKKMLFSHKIDIGFVTRLYRASVSLILLNFIALANTSIILLKCVDMKDHSVLFIDGEITCYRSWQYGIMAFISFFILPFILVMYFGVKQLTQNHDWAQSFIFGLLFPCYFLLSFLFYRVFYKNVEDRDVHDNETVDNHDNYLLLIPDSVDEEHDEMFLTNEVKKEDEMADCLLVASDAILQVLTKPYMKDDNTGLIYWECILLLRRLVVVILAAFIGDHFIRLQTITIFLCLALLHHHIMQPFRHRFINHLETALLLLLLIFCGFNLFFAHMMDEIQISEHNRVIANVYDWTTFCILVAIPSFFLVVISIAIVIRVLYGVFTICWCIFKCIKFRAPSPSSSK